MATVQANLNALAVLISSVEDHVHILFNMGRTVTLAQVFEDVKKIVFQMDQNAGAQVRSVCMAGRIRWVFRERVQCAKGGE